MPTAGKRQTQPTMDILMAQDDQAVRQWHPMLHPLPITALTMLLGMTAFEELKQLLFRGITLWQSHLLTILFSTVVATIAASILVRRHRTLQRQSELARATLYRNDVQLAEAQALAHVGSWTMNIATGSEVWSDEFYRIYGLEPQSEPASCEAFLSYVHPEDRSPVMTAVERACLHGGTFGQEYRIVRADGSIRVIIDHARVIVDQQGTPTWIMGASQDITKRKLAEHALVESEQRLRMMMDQAPDAIFTTDPAGQILDANVKASEMLGYTHAELLHLTAQDYAVLTNQQDVAGQWQELLQTGKTMVIECSIRRKDGTHFLAESISKQLADGRLQTFVRDLTERLRSEQAHQARLVAEQANAAKSEFLSRMSHELRTPLNAILGFAQVLEMEGLEPSEQESVDQILKGGRHLLTLINEVLDITAVESGRLSISPEPVDIGDLVAETIALITPVAAHYRVTLATVPAQDCHHSVLANQQWLKQVLLNLLANAIKYNRSGGSVHLSYTVVAPDRLRLAVHDTGAGIPAHLLSRLFMPFERLDAAQTTIEGTGLGLALSKRLMEAMGGSIGVQSIVGTGSTFWIELPLVATNETPVMMLTADAKLDRVLQAMPLGED